jgi:hypothetical protein
LLEKYDIVLFPCQGDEVSHTAAAHQNIVNYLDHGGRVFATHYSYVWFFETAPFTGTAHWDVDGYVGDEDQTGYIKTTNGPGMPFPKGKTLAQWLQIVGASTTYGQIPLTQLRTDVASVIAPTQLWMEIHDPSQGTLPAHITFNTPVGKPAAEQCGRVVFDDFHVEGSSSGAYPAECSSAAMTPQEKLLEFMIFDLSSCVTPDEPTCTPKTCAQLGVECGPAGDGCGALLPTCGTCPTGQTCGGGGTPSRCGSLCQPETCAGLGYDCGLAGDGCGSQINCGACPSGQTCGGGGMPGKCGNMTCAPTTCATLGVSCGPAGNGCGDLMQCGSCPAGQTCGGGGTAGKCGSPMCTPKTCAQLGFNCGPAGNGCGGTVDCGACPGAQTCGGDGKPGVCGGGPH